MSKTREDLEREFQRFLEQEPETEAQRLEREFAEFQQRERGLRGIVSDVGSAVGGAISEIGSSPLSNLPGPIPLIKAAVKGPEQMMAEEQIFTLGLAGSTAGLVSSLVEAPRDLFRIESDIPVLTIGSRALRSIQQTSEEMIVEMVQQGKVDPEKAQNLAMLGGMTGFVLPGVTAYKFIGAIARFPGLSILSAPAFREMASGQIFGFLLTPGELEERVQAAALEGSLGLAFGVTFNPGRSAFRAQAQVRASTKRLAQQFFDGIEEAEDAVTGARVPILDKNTAPAVNQVLSEEHRVVTSTEGIAMMQQTADRRAAVAAIKQTMQNEELSHGILRDVQDVDTLLPRMEEDFPDLVFHVRKKGDLADVAFGWEPIPDGSLRVWNRTGFVPGQVVRGPKGKEYLVHKVLGVKSPRLGVIDPVTKTTHTFRPDRVTATNEFRVDPSNVKGTFVDDFLEYWEERIDRLAHESVEPKEIRGAKRDVPDMGGVRDVEELGKATEEVLSELDDATLASATPAESFPHISFDDAILQWAKERGFLRREATRGPGGKFTGSEIIEPADLQRIKIAAAARISEKGFASLTETEQAAFKQLAKDYAQLSDEFGRDLDSLAQSRGFDEIMYLRDGRIRIHDTTGTQKTQIYTNEEAAIEGMLNIDVRPGDMSLGLVHPTTAAGPHAGGGTKVDDAPWLMFGDDFFENIRQVIKKKVPVGLDKAWQTVMIKPALRNTLDWTIAAERITGLPLWTGLWRIADEAINEFNRSVAPITSAYARTFRGVSNDAALNLGKAWQRGAFTGLNSQGTARAAKAAGIKPELARKVRLLDAGVVRQMRERLGITIDSYLDIHYRVIQPLVRETGTLDDAAIVGAREANQRFLTGLEQRFRAEFGRDIDPEFVKFIMKHKHLLAQESIDPRHVLAKITRQTFDEIHIDPVFQKIEAFTKPNDPMGINTMRRTDPERYLQILERLSPGDPESGLKMIRTMAAVQREAIHSVKGHGHSMTAPVSRAMRFISNQLGGTLDERTASAMANIMLSNVYGATLGMRPAVVIRDWFQNYWNLGSRLGFKYADTSMKRAMQQQVFDKWRMAGALEIEAGRIPGGETFLQRDILEAMPHEGLAGEGLSTAGPIKRLILKGERRSAQINRLMLSPYSSQDEFLRAWAAEWQFMHTQDVIRRAGGRSRVIGLEDKALTKFTDDALPFYDTPVKDNFMKLLRNMGEEEALRFVGLEAARESNFIYRRFAQPGWVQKPLGRLAGQFVTWPMWQSEMYLRRFMRGTGVQRAAFVARSAAVMTALSSLGLATGTDMGNWMSPTEWYKWMGGPAIGIGLLAYEFARAPNDRKAGAFERLGKNLIRVQLPGYGFYADARDALEEGLSPEQQFFSMMYGWPQDTDGNYYLDMIAQPGLAAGAGLNVGNIEDIMLRQLQIEQSIEPLIPLRPEVREHSRATEVPVAAPPTEAPGLLPTEGAFVGNAILNLTNQRGDEPVATPDEGKP